LHSVAQRGAWWRERYDELLEIAGRSTTPCMVYNEETINDILFDFLYLEDVKEVFFPCGIGFHPDILDKALRMGAGFTCTSTRETKRLSMSLSNLGGSRVLLVQGGEMDGPVPELLTACICRVLDEAVRLEDLSGGPEGAWIFVSLDLGSRREEDISGVSVRKGVERVIRGLKEFPVSWMGFYLKGLDGVLREGIPRETVDWMSDLSSAVPGERLIVLGEGAVVLRKDETGRVAQAPTAEVLEMVREIFPDFDLWLDPGIRAFEASGLLLVREGDIKEGGGDPFGILEWAGRGPTGGIGRPFAGAYGGIKAGDVFVFPFLGAWGAAQDRIPKHYLRARRMCLVPL